jgi:hypothetical protein
MYSKRHSRRTLRRVYRQLASLHTIEGFGG